MKMQRFQAPAYWTALIASLSMALAAGVDPRQDDVNARIRRVEAGLIPAGAQEAAPATLTDRMAHYKVPGVSMAVINGNRIEWAKAYGVGEAGMVEPATPRTLFQAASISKPVAAMGALRLVEEGALELDEDVNQKLILWKVPENDHIRSKPVTLRGIVSHSAGLTVHGFPGYAENSALPTLIQILDGGKPANTAAIRVDIEPGTRWRYSGGGFCVMQQMITDVTGKAFPAASFLLPLDPSTPLPLEAAREETQHVNTRTRNLK